MLAAASFGLVQPSLEMAAETFLGTRFQWVPCVLGFTLAFLFLHLLSTLLKEYQDLKVKTKNDSWHRVILLVCAITIHNFPEGLAVGVAFGAAGGDESFTSVGSAIALAIGIAIQNFPEGLAVSFPLRREGMSRFKSWFWGQASALCVPIAGVIGASISLLIRSLLPYALGFAGGAMFYVVVEELLPASHSNGNIKIVTYGFLFGFITMLSLDAALE